MVGIAGEKGDEAVIRRAARIAARTPGSDLIAVHVDPDDGLTAGPDRTLETQRALVASVGGSFQLIPGEDISETLLRFARAENATQIVLGASLRGRLLTLLTGKSIPTRVARRAEHIDVHLVSRDRTATGGWSLPDVIADASLLNRILTSLLADATRRSSAGPPPVLTASSPNGQVEIRITDQGPDERGGPTSLAVRLATDLAEAMGITLRCERTPSGGRTVIIILPATARSAPTTPSCTRGSPP